MKLRTSPIKESKKTTYGKTGERKKIQGSFSGPNIQVTGIPQRAQRQQRRRNYQRNKLRTYPRTVSRFQRERVHRVPSRMDEDRPNLRGIYFTVVQAQGVTGFS